MKNCKHYSVDEFNGNHIDFKESATKEFVEKKINLLYDFAILCKKKGKNGAGMPDHREDAVREMLTECKTESAMSIKLHDVLKGNYDLNTLLKRNSYM